MKNLVLINHAIGQVMSQYFERRGYGLTCIFDSKTSLAQDSVIFELRIMEGLIPKDLFKLVLSSNLILEMEEDDSVDLVCSSFRRVIEEYEKVKSKDKLSSSPRMKTFFS